MADNTYVLVDGSSFLFRAYFASKNGFSTKDGIPTGATLLITRMMQNLIKEYKEHKIIVVFDAKGKSFRAQMYQDYKANRPPMPEDLKIQIEYIEQIIKALGLPIVSIANVEADDVIGTYASKAKAMGDKVIICSSDKDLAQLVDDNCILVDTMKNKSYDANGVKEKFGVMPCYIVDMLALIGDSSDNIPGMKGVGEVSAINLINNIGGIEDIKNNLDKVCELKFRGSKNFAKSFIEQYPMIKLSYDLATIKLDVNVPELESFCLVKEDTKALIALFERLEFSKLKAELLHNNPEYKEVKEADIFDSFDPFDQDESDKISKISLQENYSLILNENALDDLCAKIKAVQMMILHVITDSPRPSLCNILGINIGFDMDKAYYIPLKHSYLGAPMLLEYESIVKKLGPLFADENIKKIGHDLKASIMSLHFHNIKVKGIAHDTMILDHLLDTTAKSSLYDNATALNISNIARLTDFGLKGVHIQEIELEKSCKYLAQNTQIIAYILDKLLAKLEANKHLEDLYYNHELVFLNVLTHIEKNGAHLDSDVLAHLNSQLLQEQNALTQSIYDLSGEKFNIASPKQLGHILFEKLGIKYPKKVKNNSYSTAEDILSQLTDHEIVKLLLRYRSVSKLISTYTDKLSHLVVNDRIYTTFNQTGTVTGRLSSVEPNLQNIPTRSTDGKKIRQAFNAPEGYKIISADYSQIELRLLAHFSEDDKLIEAFNNNLDIHAATAAEVLSIPLNEVTADQRAHAKATNFGLIYGMGARKLSLQTSLNQTQAKEYIDNYFKRYSKVKSYLNSIVDNAQKTGYISTLIGRTLNFQVLNANVPTLVRLQAQRAALNAPMQSSAADIIKLAMIKIDEYISSLGQDNLIKMTLQVHDELVFEIKESFINEACQKIKEIMENVVKLKVPLRVGIGIADNWSDAH